MDFSSRTETDDSILVQTGNNHVSTKSSNRVVSQWFTHTSFSLVLIWDKVMPMIQAEHIEFVDNSFQTLGLLTTQS